MRVLIRVLRKVHRALRPDGLLLLTQPTPENARIRLSVEGATEIDEELDEPNFNSNVRLTLAAIEQVVHDRVYAIKDQTIVPVAYSYGSLGDWLESHTPFCKDLDALTELAAKIRAAAAGSQHEIKQDYRECRMLMRRL